MIFGLTGAELVLAEESDGVGVEVFKIVGPLFLQMFEGGGNN